MEFGTKKELRKFIREQKKRHSAEQLKAMSQEIDARLHSYEKCLKASTILIFCALPDEPETLPVIEQLFSQGKRLLLPEVIDDERMRLRIYSGRESLHEGAFGILEPTGEIFTDYSEIELAVIPGMAFDAKGNRLGRGKGYYDRFLPLIPQAYKLGICFPFQKLESIPTDENDIPVDEVL